MALGNFLFAVSGMYIFIVEYFLPDEIELAEKLVREKSMEPGKALQEARRKKKKQRSGFL